MAFRAVLDANVLYPFSLRDTLLRLAEAELYVPLWSTRILDEMTRSLVRNGVVDELRAKGLVSAMKGAFEEASVQDDAVAQLEGAMANHLGDRHVLAAAVAGSAEVVVTINLRHFPTAACEPLGVEAMHPDDFLLVLFSKAPGLVRALLRKQAADLSAPPMTYRALLGLLEKSVPRFVATIAPDSIAH